MKTIIITKTRKITTPFLSTEEAAKFCDWCLSKFRRMARDYCLPAAGEKHCPRYLAPVLVQWLIDIEAAPDRKDPGFSQWMKERAEILKQMQKKWAEHGYTNGHI